MRLVGRIIFFAMFLTGALRFGRSFRQSRLYSCGLANECLRHPSQNSFITRRINRVLSSPYGLRLYSFDGRTEDTDVQQQALFKSSANASGTLSGTFSFGTPVKICIMKFGPLGASVMVNDDLNTRGLVLQREIAMFRDKRDGQDVIIGEILDGYVERIREDGRLDICLRPLGVDRIKSVREVVMEALEGSPSGSIPIGDKSPPESVSSYLHGISKKDFKNAVGSLYKEGLVKPGELEIRLMTEKERVERLETVEAINRKHGKYEEPSGNKRIFDARENARKVFIGNLPFRVQKEAVLKVITPILGRDTVVDLRLSLNEEGQPRGFGYLILKDEAAVEGALEKLKTIEVGGRRIRVDYADRSKSKRGGSEEGDKRRSSEEYRLREKYGVGDDYIAREDNRKYGGLVRRKVVANSDSTSSLKTAEDEEVIQESWSAPVRTTPFRTEKSKAHRSSSEDMDLDSFMTTEDEEMGEGEVESLPRRAVPRGDTEGKQGIRGGISRGPRGRERDEFPQQEARAGSTTEKGWVREAKSRMAAASAISASRSQRGPLRDRGADGYRGTRGEGR